MRFRNKNGYQNEENIFWITMTDLMLGLVLVFMILFFYSSSTSYFEKIRDQSITANVNNELAQKLNEQSVEASVDLFSGVVNISDLELFEVNSWELSPKGKAYLQKFVPIYVNTIFGNEDYKGKIAGIVIQGHTDSQTFKGISNSEEQYMKNMELSLKRAYSVASYFRYTNYDKKYSKDLEKKMLVEGCSYSKPIYNSQGKEDFEKSRRVELKIVTLDKLPGNVLNGFNKS